MSWRGMSISECLRLWLEMSATHRIDQLPEIAACVLLLASGVASLVTGSVLVADGGYTAW